MKGIKGTLPNEIRELRQHFEGVEVELLGLFPLLKTVWPSPEVCPFNADYTLQRASIIDNLGAYSFANLIMCCP